MSHLLDERQRQIDEEEITSLGHEYLEIDRVTLGEGVTVEIHQDRNVMRNETGGAIWDAAVVLGYELVQRWEEIAGHSVVELGAGTGFVSSAVAAVQAQRGLGGTVWATDYAAMEGFMAANVARHAAEGQWRSLALDWFDEKLPAEFAHHGAFDVVVASDVLYSGEAIGPLARTLHALSGPNSIVYVAHKTRFPWVEERFFRRKIPQYFGRQECVHVAQPKHYPSNHEVRIIRLTERYAEKRSTTSIH